VADQWFSPDILVSSTNKTGCHNITEILLKVALNTITNPFVSCPIKNLILLSDGLDVSTKSAFVDIFLCFAFLSGANLELKRD
jgi:hypothetical protein